MQKVTITITPNQAAKIVHVLQQGQDVALRFRQSAKRGQQKGGMWGMLAKLAAPIATGLLGGVASYGANKLMGKLTGSGCGCGKGPSITCSPRQMHVLVGSGAPVAINFKVSKSRKHRAGMMGAGMMDSLVSTLPTLIATAMGKAAPKVAESAGNAAGGYISGKVNKYFSGAKKPAVVQPSTASRPAYRPRVNPFAGGGIRLAGRGQRGDGWFDDIVDEVGNFGKEAVNIGQKVGKQVGRTAQKKFGSALNAANTHGRTWVMKNLM